MAFLAHAFQSLRVPRLICSSATPCISRHLHRSPSRSWHFPRSASLNFAVPLPVNPVPCFSLAVQIKAVLRPCYSPLSFSVSLRSGSMLRLRVHLSSGHSITFARRLHSTPLLCLRGCASLFHAVAWPFRSMPRSSLPLQCTSRLGSSLAFPFMPAFRSAIPFLSHALQFISAAVPLSSLPILRDFSPLRFALAWPVSASPLLFCALRGGSFARSEDGSVITSPSPDPRCRHSSGISSQVNRPFPLFRHWPKPRITP